ncbi:hypothetical protein GYMLUDRAFT_236945 [Collybiopsis luxurians FD-317 M1]|nr:hypothetical protein GYMLUDRAFT_236945 [Collybiopsis luxurians FD-317 M1]
MSSQNLTLDKLNIDILYTILLILHDVSRHSLFSTLSTNRTLYSATLPVLHRSCALDYTPGDKQAESMARVESWLKDGFDSVIFTFMRDLTVKDTLDYWQLRYRDKLDEASGTHKWDSLVQLLIRIPNLASFTFDCHEQMPIIILDTLHSHHPTTHLHIRNWTRTAEDRVFGDPAEEALANSSCLRSLHGHFITGGSPDADYRFSAFNRIVKLSPNLESISKTSRSAGGCVVYGFSPGEWEIRDAEMRKFKVDGPRRKVIKSLEMNFGDAAVLKDLDTYIDLGQLATLKSIRLASDFMFLAAEESAFRLSSLAHLDVKLHAQVWGEDGENAQNELTRAFKLFLTSLSPLQSLSVVLDTSRPWSSILSTILLHHSTSLKTLSLHQKESPSKESMRVCLTLEEVNDICNNYSELTSFALDIDRTLDKEQERAYYAILRRSINLRELTIHMDLGLAYHAENRQLFWKQLKKEISDDDPDIIRHRQRKECYREADEAFARQVWEEVSQRNSSRKGVQLLVLCMGEQNREIGHGLPADWVRAEQSRRQRVTVQRNERDDRLDEVDVTIIARSH